MISCLTYYLLALLVIISQRSDSLAVEASPEKVSLLIKPLIFILSILTSIFVLLDSAKKADYSFPQSAFTCSKLTIEALEQGLEDVQS